MKLFFASLAMGILAVSVSGQAPDSTSPRNGSPPSPKLVTRIQVSKEIAATQLKKHGTPQYPDLARQTRITGVVKLRAIVGTDGKIKQLNVISGHPLLVPAVLDSVRGWVYEPMKVNGELVEMDTTIEVPMPWVSPPKDKKAGKA
jgi:protein TonB